MSNVLQTLMISNSYTEFKSNLERKFVKHEIMFLLYLLSYCHHCMKPYLFFICYCHHCTVRTIFNYI